MNTGVEGPPDRRPRWCLLPQGGLSSGDAPPIVVVAKSAKLRFRLRRKLRPLPCSSSPHRAGRGEGPIFGLAKRETGRARSKEKSVRRAPVQWPSARDGVGVSVQAPIWACLRARYSLLRSRHCRPVADGADGVWVVVVLPLLLFSLPLAVLHGSVSGSGERRRMYPCTSPGQRFHQGQRVSVPDRREGQPAIPRQRQEVCAGADRPAEHFFFSTGRGAFSF